MNPDKDILLWDGEHWHWTTAARELTHDQRHAISQLVYGTYWEPRVLEGRIEGRIERVVYQTFQNNIYMRRS